MRLLVGSSLTLSLLLVTSPAAFAQRCDPTGADAAAIAAARAAADAACDCNAPDQSHGQYVSCAVQAINSSGLRMQCRGFVKKCYSRSTCGKPGFVTCCRTRTNPHGVTSTKCSIKSDATHCTAPDGQSACTGTHPSCCDACTDSGCAP